MNITSDETRAKLKQLLDGRDFRTNATTEAEIIKLLDKQYHTGHRDGYGEGRNETEEEMQCLRNEIATLQLGAAKIEDNVYVNALRRILEVGDQISKNHAITALNHNQ